ncbi:MAG: ABC transporter ATP-binding protein [Gammaproteobacteria bacterium]|nr:ABC transporter ATP-binding protein [Gammaproteobacteria bacterium]
MRRTAGNDDDVIIVDRVSKSFRLRHNHVESLKGRFVGIFKRRWRQRSEQFCALDDVSFRVRRGESLALMGLNGSGKSTLLQIIAGILKPSSGRVQVRGRVAPLIELGVGFHPELTGEENIYLNASLYGFRNREIRARLGKIVEFSELGHFIDIPVKNYSSGMYMRLGFSVAVHLDPEILLADEILAVGDLTFQDKCHSKIGDLQRAGMTLILVSHNTEQVSKFCAKFIRLEKGRMAQTGRLRGKRMVP